MTVQGEWQADIGIIGAGSGGLSVAAGAAQMGASVVLVERHRMGGDCLNTGCVPSKSLLAAAHAAHAVRQAAGFGVACSPPMVHMEQVHQHVQEVIAGIAPHDSQERFEKLGVRVLREEGRFVAPDTLQAGAYRIRARRFVIATGSSPALPDLPGLASVPFLTNETLFDVRELPAHLVILGGGPIGMEMAQAFCRLGSQVTLLARGRLLRRDDTGLVDQLQTLLTQEGIRFHTGLRVLNVAPHAHGVILQAEENGHPLTITGSHLLVAVGRRPNVQALNLEKAHVACHEKGIQVDARLRTTNPRIFAIGDVAGPHLFTHMAGYQAGIVLRNILFRLPAKVDDRAVPWVTYTDPELAQVGLTEESARQAGLAVRVLTKSFLENDRARSEKQAHGQVKVMVTPRGRILGVSMLGPHAGELIQPWILAITRHLPMAAMAQWIAPYPTLGEINKGVAGSYFTPSLFSDRTKRLVRWLARLG